MEEHTAPATNSIRKINRANGTVRECQFEKIVSDVPAFRDSGEHGWPWLWGYVGLDAILNE